MQIDRLWETYDLHVGGVPVRLVEGRQLSGCGVSMTDWYRDPGTAWEGESLRRRLVQEPWGYEGLKAAILVPPHQDSSAAGLLFMDAERFSPQCVRSLIAAAIWFHETGQVAGESACFDTPAGPRRVTLSVEKGRTVATVSVGVPKSLSPGRPHSTKAGTVPVWLRDGDSEAQTAFMPSPFPLDLAPEHVLAVRALGREVLAERDWKRLVLFEAPTDLRKLGRAVAVRASGTIERAVGASVLSELAALWVQEGRMSPGDWGPVTGLCDVPVEVRVGPPCHGTSGAASADVRAPAFPIALRRFYESSWDTVAPFLVP